MKTYKYILIALALVLITACKDKEPETHYKYLIWIGSAGHCAHSYEIKNGLVYFETASGRKVIATSFEIEESKKGCYA